MICPVCSERWGSLDAESPYEFNSNVEMKCNLCEAKLDAIGEGW